MLPAGNRYGAVTPSSGLMSNAFGFLYSPPVAIAVLPHEELLPIPLRQTESLALGLFLTVEWPLIFPLLHQRQRPRSSSVVLHRGRDQHLRPHFPRHPPTPVVSPLRSTQRHAPPRRCHTSCSGCCHSSGGRMRRTSSSRQATPSIAHTQQVSVAAHPPP